MRKKLTYESFLSLPVKGRIALVSEVLENLWHYTIDKRKSKHDRAYRRALIDFQQSRGLAGNAVVCRKTFELLQVSTYYGSHKE